MSVKRTVSPGKAPVNFADTVGRLGKTIEATMASLYDLQTAAVNAKGRKSTSLSDMFQNVKQPLRAEWESLMDFFKSCHAFGEDIAFLKESIGTESSEDILNFLQDMGETSAELLKTAARLLETIHAPIVFFNQQRGVFLDLFGKADPNPQQRRLEASNADQMGDTYAPIGVARDTATASFVDGALASLYPNGVAVLLATETHFRDMLALYGDVATFWKNQNDEFITGSKSKAGIPISRVNQIADSWAASQKALTVTIATISRSCDAVGVESKGAPRPSKVVYQSPADHEISGMERATQFAYSFVQGGNVALPTVPGSTLNPPASNTPVTKPVTNAAQTASVVKPNPAEKAQSNGKGSASNNPFLKFANSAAQTAFAVKPNLAGTSAATGQARSTASNGNNPPVPPPRHPNSTSNSQSPQVKK